MNIMWRLSRFVLERKRFEGIEIKSGLIRVDLS